MRKRSWTNEEVEDYSGDCVEVGDLVVEEEEEPEEGVASSEM